MEYELLKDSPEAKAGQVYERTVIPNGLVGAGGYVYVPQGQILSYSATFNDNVSTYKVSTIENNPEWFKLIEPKEFTESDMINAIGKCQNSPYTLKTVEQIIQEIRQST